MPNQHDPALTLTKTEARRFLLDHHGLYPPRQRAGKTGVLDYIRHVNCIQFDPINIVGRNPDLVLQSRVEDYRQAMLDEILYEDRNLLDGWDKLASIYPVEDWPYFLRRQNHLRSASYSRKPPQTVLNEVLEEVRQRGPLSSLDFDDSEKVDWFWGPTKIVRAALEHLYEAGHLGINHRVNNRRVFDLIERLLPEKLLTRSDPHVSDEAYQDWHVLRRIGSLGLAHPNAGEYWLGILKAKSPERNAALQRLIQLGKIIPVAISEISGQTLYLRGEDLPALQRLQKDGQAEARAAFIAPLDNLIWNRKLTRQIFDFEYTWEVYKPASQRQYGYYVLPVIYGDRFIARVDFAFGKKERALTLQNWWWEDGVLPEEKMTFALADCLRDFIAYLEASQVKLGEAVEGRRGLDFAREVIHELE